MSAEVIVGTAAGVTAAGMALVFDQNLAMASAGGIAFMLAVSVAIPLQTRLFFGIGSFVLGYIVGLLMMAQGNLGIFAALMAFGSSALGSTIFGSLHGWVADGKMPAWVGFVIKLLPFSIKKGGNE